MSEVGEVRPVPHGADPELVAQALLIARAAGGIAAAVGAVALGAALFGTEAAPVMHVRAATALAFAVAGATLSILVDPGHGSRGLARGMALAVLGLALAMRALAVGPASPAAAPCFALIAVALFAVAHAPRTRVGLAISFVTMCTSLAVLMGHAYGVIEPMFAGAALGRPTAIAFAILGLGIACAHGEHGPMAILLRRTPGGLVARNLFVPIFTFLAIVRVAAQRAGAFDSPVGVAFVVIVTGLLAVYLMWRTASLLDRADADRRDAQDALERANDELEQRVELRTRQLRESEAAMALARDAAIEASRAKSEFLASMSHELRTPLNAVVGVTWLLEQTQLTDEQRQHTQLVRDGGMQLLTVIDDVLDLAKIEAGKLALAPRPFATHGLFDSAVRLLAPRAAEKGLTLELSIAPDVPQHVVGDEARLRQVLINLLGNAVKFTERGRVDLVVRAERAAEGSGRIVVAIRDTGIGIPADKLEMVFERFTQADASTTRRYGGTGLGLAICRELIELMGGTIGVKSEPGVGSEFHFAVELPHASASEPSSQPGLAEAAARAAAAVAQGARVLVVEDDPTNQFVTRRMLELLGCEVTIAPSGPEALSHAAAHEFDIVFMDCQMPAMDGYETTGRFRASSGWETPAQVPIVGLTAYAMRGDRAKCLEAGMDDYLAKPVAWEQMRGALERWVRRTRPRAPAPEPVTPPAALPVLDQARVAFFREMDVEGQAPMIVELARSFESSTGQTLTELRRAIAAGDAAQVRALRHKLEGASLNLGATQLATLVILLPREGPLDAAACEVTLDAIERAFAEVRDELARLAAEPSELEGSGRRRRRP